MILPYRIAYLPLLLASMPYYAWRMAKRGGYSKDFSHRFGLLKNLPEPEPGKTRIWIQAVSVGEVEALSTLLRLLHESGRYETVVTTTTSTGYGILREKYAKYCLCVGVFPFDFYPFIRAAWRRIKPDICALMEGELWPEHMHAAKASGTPLLLLNARLSDRTFARYKKIGSLARRIFSKLDFVAAGSAPDAERFISLGADPSKIENTGNLKFDSKPDALLSGAETAALKREFGFGAASAVMLGSSTWPGEEEMLAETLARLEADARLLLVPRHAERREQIRAALEKTGLPFHFRTSSRQAPEGTMIYVADTTGELRTLTQAADFAFVGKSLPPNKGGQTPIDCAASGVPSVYGPNMTNFRHVCAALEKAGASVRARDAEDARAALQKLASDPDLRAEMGARAKAWHSSNIGASARTMRIIDRFARK